jgi:hypothetical protein
MLLTVPTRMTQKFTLNAVVCEFTTFVQFEV